jgi:hypothetical protein
LLSSSGRVELDGDTEEAEAMLISSRTKTRELAMVVVVLVLATIDVAIMRRKERKGEKQLTLLIWLAHMSLMKERETGRG